MKREILSPSKSQEDIKSELNQILLNNQNKLKPNLITFEGPNSKQQVSFGGTLKMENTIKIEKSDINSTLNNIENWKLYNQVGQTIPRAKVAKVYGKLLDNPGPGEYTPDLNVSSTSEPSHKYTLHSRTYYEPVDKLDTPGPGTYTSPSGIRPEIERFRKDPIPEAEPIKQKVGPGTYVPSRSAEYGKFHREVCAIMPKRDEGTIRRATVDLHTLYVHKSKKKQTKSKELPTSHLGPGTYFHPTETNLPVTNPTVDLTATGKKQWKIESNRTKFYDCDPMSPTPSYFTIGEKRKDGALITDPFPPGPGTYSPDRSLFGSNNLLSEGGGAVTRPGKLSLNTSASEGIIRGQHAPAIYSLPIKKSTSKLISTIKVIDPQTEKVHTITAKWKEKSNSNNLNNNQYKLTSSQKIFHNCGRGTESSVQDRNYTFRGRNSPGTFLRFG